MTQYEATPTTKNVWLPEYSRQLWPDSSLTRCKFENFFFSISQCHREVRETLWKASTSRAPSCFRAPAICAGSHLADEACLSCAKRRSCFENHVKQQEPARIRFNLNLTCMIVSPVRTDQNTWLPRYSQNRAPPVDQVRTIYIERQDEVG